MTSLLTKIDLQHKLDDLTTLTGFNVDVSAIENNGVTQAHLLVESPNAASMLLENMPEG